jgi:hypothetical protein
VTNHHQTAEAPTPKALADLVARCDQINRYETQLTAAEESRVAALASGLLVMRQVLQLELLDPEKLPARQGRISHWLLRGGDLEAEETPAIQAMHGTLALDEHEQVKVLTNRTWRGAWRNVTLWRSGALGLSSLAMMEYLAALTKLAHQRSPDVARALLARSEAVVASDALLAGGPRTRGA